ncbi:hypothetical protein [Spirulina sp. 06S082]|uniref:hypothetical protein n=1 Tax=Spirulina sp. 06S082 TaxID=3110248 RepID=UPI002B1F96B4|nr:hypothetical protein [Spirulina sp. 06S082]MEA5471421.1 hypothetical protein [Spirulina sp. 06S082]
MLTAAIAVQSYRITVSQNPPERLKGFGEGVPPMTSKDLYPHPPNPKDTLLEKLLRLRGFGEGQQPNLPTHTGHPRDNTLDDLIRYIFPTEEFVPNGKLSRVTDKWLKSNGIDAHDVKEYLPGPAKYFDIYVDQTQQLFGVRKGQKPEEGEYLGDLEDFQE